jgi:hypothetical protein
MDATTAKIAQAIRNQYVIGYRAPLTHGTEKWHRIAVRANLPYTRVAARAGYYSQ